MKEASFYEMIENNYKTRKMVYICKTDAKGAKEILKVCKNIFPRHNYCSYSHYDKKITVKYSLNSAECKLLLKEMEQINQ